MASSRRIGFGARLPLPSDLPRDRLIEGRLDKLSRLLNRGSVVAVVGAGVSAARGYPTWQGWTLDAIDAGLVALRAGGTEHRALGAELAVFREQVTSGGAGGSKDWMFWIGETLRAMSPTVFERFVRERFSLRSDRACAPEDPFRALLELPIKRFMTTNFDCEIERALVDYRGCRPETFGVDDERLGKPWQPANEALSFTHERQFADRLARFALARCDPLNEHMVFHAHGRYDRPASIIATEAQYQRAYLAEERGGRFSFVQTIDLLLRSNTVLFVGYGLEDEDLLRPLRVLSTMRREVGRGSTAFALLEEPFEGAHWFSTSRILRTQRRARHSIRV